MYIASTSRFMLFDAITQNRYRLREGWRRWSGKGLRFFWFYLGYSFAAFGLLLLVTAPLILVVWRNVANKTNAFGTVFGVLLLTLPFLLVVGITCALYFLFAKDFTVPIMALEDTTFLPSMSRVWQMIKAAKGDFAAYVGMKIVLAIGYGIVMFIVQLLIFIPVFIVGVIIAVALGVSIPTLFSSPVMIAAAITGVMIVFFLLLFVISVIAAPAVMFFQAYSLIFFAPRYLPLYYLMYGPPAPEPPPATAPPAEPEGPPPFPPELAPTS
jgi:hypothetical protein